MFKVKALVAAGLSFLFLSACEAELLIYPNQPSQSAGYLSQDRKHSLAIQIYGYKTYMTRGQLAVGTRHRVTERMLLRWGGGRVPYDVVCYPKRRQGVLVVFCSHNRQLSWLSQQIYRGYNPSIGLRKLPQGTANMEAPVYVSW